jgi:hypothetical protein
VIAIYLLVCFSFPALVIYKGNLSIIISDHIVRLFGLAIVSGLIFGYVNLDLSQWFKTLLLCAYLITAVWIAHRGYLNTEDRAHVMGESNFLLIIPGVFVIAATLITALYPNRAISYLLNTWDGSSNAGLVRGMEVASSIDFSPNTRIGQWSNYPRGAHYLASWLAEVTSLSSDHIAKNLAITFVFVIWIVYAFLILQLGRFVNLMSHITGLGRTGIPVVLVSQALLLSPMFINEILKLHSLAFITAMAAGVYAIVLVLGALYNRDKSLSTYIMTSSLLFVIACHTYPLVVPIVLVTLIPPVFMRSCFTAESRMNDQVKILASVFFYAIGIVSFFSLVNSTDPGNRYAMGGHMYVMETRWLYLLVALSTVVVLLIFLRDKKLACILFLIVLCLCVMWRGLWFLADSDDRSYGMNYYPKKMEYFLVVLLLPVAMSLSFFVWLKTKKFWHKFQFSLVLCASLFVLASQTWNGALDALFVPILRDRGADEVVPVIIRESEIPGRSVIWDSQNGDLSRSASFLTNYLDKSSWQVAFPDSWELNVILHQQLIQKTSATTPAELCYLVFTEEFGPGRVVDFQNQTTLDCSRQ